LHIICSNLAIGGSHRINTAIIEALQMAARHSQVNAANFDIRHFLRLHNGAAHIFFGHRHVNDLALADTTRACLAEADDVEGVIGGKIANYGANFGSADFQANDDGGTVKHFSSGSE